MKIKKLFETKWLKIYQGILTNKKGKEIKWDFVSRKNNPIEDKNKPDAVVIIPIVRRPEGNLICITKEFRAPLNDYEWGFPAGLIDEGENFLTSIYRELKEETGLDCISVTQISHPIYSSAGMTDESVIMAFANCEGEISQQYQEKSEDIEVFLMSVEDIKKLIFDSNKKIGGKAWGILYHYYSIGRID